MSTLFTRIIRGEVPAHKILEDSSYLAFLDTRPVSPGHTLVIPKIEIDYIFDADDALLAGLMSFAKKTAAAIRRAVPCKKVGLMVAGLEVPHLHLHLIPINAVSDLSFARARQADPGELETLANRIRECLPAPAR